MIPGRTLSTPEGRGTARLLQAGANPFPAPLRGRPLFARPRLWGFLGITTICLLLLPDGTYGVRFSLPVAHGLLLLNGVLALAMTADTPEET